MGPRLRRIDLGSDRGAYAVMYAVVIVMLVGFAALALDISMQFYQQQRLQNVIDAAVVAGSYELDGQGSGSSGPVQRAKDAVTASVNANDPSLAAQAVPTFFCVVASKKNGDGTRWIVDTDQVGATKVCDPGVPASPYSMAQCNSVQCAIPCLDADSCKPNTIRLGLAADVPYALAPVIGIINGSTGGVVSVACKGGCGAQAGAPVDMIIIGDRTPSMDQTERSAEAAAITSALGELDPATVHVGIGMVGYSTTNGSCALYPGSSNLTTNSPGISGWVPIGLPSSNGWASYNYNNITSQLNNTNCFRQSQAGTWLASPLRAAAQYLFNPAVGVGGNLQPNAVKAIIFETDGQPYEGTNWSGSNGNAITVGNALTGFWNTGGQSGTNPACTYLQNVATALKDPNQDGDPSDGILMIFVKYGNESGTCPLQNYVSPHPVTDAPMIYYASTSADFTDAFSDAVSAATSGARLMNFPAPGDDLLGLTG